MHAKFDMSNRTEFNVAASNNTPLSPGGTTSGRSLYCYAGSNICWTEKGGLVLTVDVTAACMSASHRQHGPAAELGSERTHRFGTGPDEQTRYPSRSQTLSPKTEALKPKA